VVGGGPLPDRFRAQSVELVKEEPARLVLDDGLGSYERRRFRWIVSGTGTVTITYDAEKGGVASATATLGP